MLGCSDSLTNEIEPNAEVRLSARLLPSPAGASTYTARILIARRAPTDVLELVSSDSASVARVGGPRVTRLCLQGQAEQLFEAIPSEQAAKLVVTLGRAELDGGVRDWCEATERAELETVVLAIPARGASLGAIDGGFGLDAGADVDALIEDAAAPPTLEGMDGQVSAPSRIH